MKYNRESIINRTKNGEILTYRFFWGNKENSLRNSLSQWYKCLFSQNGLVFNSAEQYMMAQKAMLFKDVDTFDMIMDASEPQHCKALGRIVGGFNSAIWDAAKYKIVLNGNFLKFSQNDELRQFLLSTGNEVLVEASPYDKVWGIGMYENHPDSHNPSLWKGDNYLGFALMEVRDILRNIEGGLE